jgi:hypothetical protein
MTEQQDKAKQAIAAMRSLGVSLNDYDSDMLEVLIDFAEDSLTINAAQAEQLAKLAANDRRYRFLRDQECMDLVGSFAPYCVQGQTMAVLDGAMLDREIDRALLQSSIPPEPQAGVELTDGANGWHEYHSLGPIRRYMLDCHMDGMDHFAEFVLASDHDSRVHDLEALCDPAGITAENALLRDQTRMLDAMIKRLKDEIADHEKAYELLFKENALNQRQAVKAEPDSGVYWRPIETVPVTKDEVLAYSKNGNQWMVNGLYLRSQMQEYPGFYTHWSQLPAGPDSEPKPEPLSAAQGVPEYNWFVGKAGDEYIQSVAYKGQHTLPAQFRWNDLFNVLLKAALAAPEQAESKEGKV